MSLNPASFGPSPAEFGAASDATSDMRVLEGSMKGSQSLESTHRRLGAGGRDGVEVGS